MIALLTAVWKADNTQVRVCLDPEISTKPSDATIYKCQPLTMCCLSSLVLLDAKDGFL